jgi:hypothetical protein
MAFHFLATSLLFATNIRNSPALTGFLGFAPEPEHLTFACILQACRLRNLLTY